MMGGKSLMVATRGCNPDAASLQYDYAVAQLANTRCGQVFNFSEGSPWQT